jgi:hypothetical protein
MFIEDGSLQYIEADAQDVISMYRSTSTVMIAHGGREKQPCEAFVCVVQDGVLSTAYVALSMQKSRSFVIFTPQKKPSDKDSSDAVVREALDFVKERGFEMQSINLNYSKALKEVVLNDLRVVRSAGSSKKVSHKKVAGDKAAKVSAVVPEKGAVAGIAPGDKSATASPVSGKVAVEKDSGKTLPRLETGEPVRKPVARPDGAESDNRGTRGEKTVGDPFFETEIAAERAARDRLQAAKVRVEKEASEELVALQAEIEAMTNEMQSVSAETSAEIASARGELERLSARKSAEKTAASEQLASLTAEVEGLRQEIASAEETTSMQMVAARNEIKKLSAEKENLEKGASAELVALQSELKRLAEERDASQKKKTRELSALKAELESLSAEEGTDGELVALREEVERLASEKTDAQKEKAAEQAALRGQIAHLEDEGKQSAEKAEQELTFLRSEFERLQKEKGSEEQRIGNELTALRAELELLRGEKETTADAASVELSALRTEREHLLLENARLEKTMTGESDQLRGEIARLEEEKNAAEETFSGVLSELRCDVERLTSEKELMERDFAEQQSVLQNSVRGLEEEITAHGELSTKQQNELSGEIALLSARKMREQEAAVAEISSLNAELVRLQEESSAAREKAGNEIEEMKAEIARLSVEIAAEQMKTSAEITELRDESSRLSQEKASAEALATEELDAVRNVVSRLTTEVAELKETNAEEVAALCSEAERLMQEREAAEQKAVASVSAAREKVERLASELLHTGNAIMEMISATHSAILGGWEGFSTDELAVENFGKAMETKGSVQGDVSRAPIEKAADEEVFGLETLDLWEEEAHPEDEKTVAEELRGKGEEFSLDTDAGETSETIEEGTVDPVDEAQQSSVAGNLKNGKTEEKVDARKSRSGRTEVAVAPSEESATDDGRHGALEDDSISQAPDTTDPFAFLNSEETQMGSESSFTDVSGGSSGPPLQFAIDKSLATVEYRSPKDIIEIYQSLNRTRVSMGDNTTVTCEAYLCGVKKDGRNHVYIALNLVDTKGVLVYVPEVQPEDSGSYVKTLRDGKDFVEIVGFMMDGVNLGGNETQRVKALDKIPVLRKVSA